jgi:hypothetical protein
MISDTLICQMLNQIFIVNTYNQGRDMSLLWQGFYRQFGLNHAMEFTSLDIELKPEGKIIGTGKD